MSDRAEELLAAQDIFLRSLGVVPAKVDVHAIRRFAKSVPVNDAADGELDVARAALLASHMSMAPALLALCVPEPRMLIITGVGSKRALLQALAANLSGSFEIREVLDTSRVTARQILRLANELVGNRRAARDYHRRDIGLLPAIKHQRELLSEAAARPLLLIHDLDQLFAHDAEAAQVLLEPMPLTVLASADGTGALFHLDERHRAAHGILFLDCATFVRTTAASTAAAGFFGDAAAGASGGGVLLPATADAAAAEPEDATAFGELSEALLRDILRSRPPSQIALLALLLRLSETRPQPGGGRSGGGGGSTWQPVLVTSLLAAASRKLIVTSKEGLLAHLSDLSSASLVNFAGAAGMVSLAVNPGWLADALQAAKGSGAGSS